MAVELLERNVYNCEIYRIPYRPKPTNRTFTIEGKEYPIGIGFYWILRVLDEGKFKDRNIMDYFFLKYDERYSKKNVNITKLLHAMKQLGLKHLVTDEMYKLEGRVLPVLISVRLNKDNELENFVEDYIINPNYNFIKKFF